MTSGVNGDQGPIIKIMGRGYKIIIIIKHISYSHAGVLLDRKKLNFSCKENEKLVLFQGKLNVLKYP